MAALTAEALAAHSFKYSPSSLDQALVDFLQRFYTFSDDKNAGGDWAGCFAENAVMKKAATNVTGRAAISEVNLASWKGQKSRQHIVFKVYPFNTDGASEVMLYGMSKYVYEDETTGEMSWAARLCFERSSGGSILINLYHIFPSSPPKAA